MQRKGLSIFKKLFIAFLTIALISLIISGGVHYKSQKEFITHTIHSQLSNSAYASSDYFYKTFASPITQDLGFIEASPLLDNFMISRKEEALLAKPLVERLFLFFTDSADSIFLSARYIDSKGNEKIITKGRFRVKDYAAKDHFADNALYRRIYSLFERLKTENVRTILFEGPFKDDNNRLTFMVGISKMDPEIGGFGGAVIFHCDLNGYMNYLAGLNFNRAPIAYVFSPDNQLLLSPGKGALPDPVRYLSQDVDNNLVVSSSITLGSNNEILLNYVLAVPREILASELKKTLIRSAVIGISIIILIGFVAFFVTMRLLVKPIRALSRGTRKIGGGDLGYRIEVETHDEIAQLADEFNRMAEGLEKTTVSRDILIQEVSDRKKAEEALLQSEVRYRTLFDESPVMDVTTYNQDGVPIIMDCNKLFADTLGYTRDELLQRPLRNFYTPETIQKITQAHSYERALSVGIYSEERQLLARDGSVVETLLRALPEKNSAGEVYGTRTIYIDITQRKKAEKALSALNAVSQTVNQSLNLDQVLNDALDKVMDMFKPHSTYIRLLDAAKQELVFALQKGLSSEELKFVTRRLKLDQAIATYAIHADKAVAIEDVFIDPRSANRHSFAKRIGCRSLVTIILYAKNRVVGNMSIRWREPHTFTDDEIQLFTSIGHQIGIAIENANLFSQVQQNTEALEALNSVSNTVSQTLDVEILTGVVLDKVIEVLHADAGTFRLLDETEQTMGIIAHKGFSLEQVKKMNTERKYGEGLAWRCFDSNQVIFTEFDPKDFYQQGIKSFGMQIGARCALHFPIVHQEVRLGIITIYSFSFREFQKEELGLCGNIGHQVGVAIENARLYQQAQNNIKALTDTQEELEKVIVKLQDALAEVKTLGELLPICSHCKNIRDDKGYWNRIEAYIHKHSGTEFSHGICPECAKKYYPEFKLYDD